MKKIRFCECCGKALAPGLKLKICETCSNTRNCQWCPNVLPPNSNSTYCEQCIGVWHKCALEIRKMDDSCKEKVGYLDAQLAAQEARLNFLMLDVDHAMSNDALGADVTIAVEDTDELLQAHSFLLAYKSSVFTSIFHKDQHKNLGPTPGKFHVHIDTTFSTMHAVLKYMYTAHIAFTGEISPDNVMKVAHAYELDLLRMVCEEEMVRTITQENLFKRLKLSRELDAKVLEQAASTFFKHNFDSAISRVLDGISAVQASSISGPGSMAVEDGKLEKQNVLCLDSKQSVLFLDPSVEGDGSKKKRKNKENVCETDGRKNKDNGCETDGSKKKKKSNDLNVSEPERTPSKSQIIDV